MVLQTLFHPGRLRRALPSTVLTLLLFDSNMVESRLWLGMTVYAAQCRTALIPTLSILTHRFTSSHSFHLMTLNTPKQGRKLICWFWLTIDDQWFEGLASSKGPRHPDSTQTAPNGTQVPDLWWAAWLILHVTSFTWIFSVCVIPKFWLVHLFQGCYLNGWMLALEGMIEFSAYYQIWTAVLLQTWLKF